MQTDIAASSRPTRFDHWFVPGVIFLGLLASLIEAARSPDPRMVVQAWTFGTCMAVIGVWYMWMYVGRTPADETRPLCRRGGQGRRDRLDVLGHRRHAGRRHHRAAALLSRTCSIFPTCPGPISGGCGRCTPRR